MFRSIIDLYSNKQLLRNQRGWVFIDVLIATVIISVAMTAIAMAYRHATVATGVARENNQAVYVAQQVLENLKRFDGVAANKAGFLSNAPNPTTPVFRDNYSKIDYYARVEDCPVSTSLDPRIVPLQVTVTWVSGNPPGPKSIPPVASYYYTR